MRAKIDVPSRAVYDYESRSRHVVEQHAGDVARKAVNALRRREDSAHIRIGDLVRRLGA